MFIFGGGGGEGRGEAIYVNMDLFRLLLKVQMGKHKILVKKKMG